MQQLLLLLLLLLLLAPPSPNDAWLLTFRVQSFQITIPQIGSKKNSGSQLVNTMRALWRGLDFFPPILFGLSHFSAQVFSTSVFKEGAQILN
jgi:hypothetical protein